MTPLKIFAVTTGPICVVVIAMLLLGGCGFTREGDAFRAAVRDFGAQGADAELENLEWGICNAASIGAVKRRYPAGSKKAAGREALCGE